MSQKLLNIVLRLKQITFMLVILTLTGCATSNDLIDEDLSGNARAEAARWSKMWEETPVTVDPQKTRPTLAPQKSTVAPSSEETTLVLSTKQQTVSRLIEKSGPENQGIVQPTTDSLGIHIATFSFEEDIEPGLNTIRRVFPDTIKSKQARAAIVDISGTNYYHLILGPYNSSTAAITDCGIIVQNIDFCDVVEFTGQVVE